MPSADAGVVDGGTTGDAGTGADAGMGGGDAAVGMPPDPGGVDEPSEGCGCSVPGRRAPVRWMLFGLVVVAMLRRRWRR